MHDGPQLIMRKASEFDTLTFVKPHEAVQIELAQEGRHRGLLEPSVL
jgi:hypothetical protein